MEDQEGVVTNGAAIAAWNRRDILASGFLYATVNEEMRDTLINCDTASAMWKQLSDQYMQNAADNKHMLKQLILSAAVQPWSRCHATHYSNRITGKAAKGPW